MKSRDQRPRILDLFAGAGGMALGFEAAGGRCVGAVEIDAAAATTFRENFSHEGPRVFGGPVDGDVNQLPVEDLIRSLPAPPDIVVGGPPCQGFSRIGRAKQMSLLDDEQRIRAGVRNPERNLLYRYFLAVVAASRPAAFVMENVPGMRALQGVDLTARIRGEAQSLGYNVRCFLLNAAWFGVPQNRWRIFFVGFRRDLGTGILPEPPIRTHSASMSPPEGMSLAHDDWFYHPGRIGVVDDPELGVTVQEALGDLPLVRSSESLETSRGHSAHGLPYRGPETRYSGVMRRWPGRVADELVEDNWFRQNTRDFETFRLMAHGDRYPEALKTAIRRFRDALSGLGSRAPEPGTSTYEELKAQFVPPYRNDAFADKWRKLIPDEPSWTLTAHLGKDAYSHIHYDSRQARTITVREAARLQSFPDAFRFAGNNGQKYQQIGNAVPPLLARAIASQVFKQLKELKSLRDSRSDPAWA